MGCTVNDLPGGTNVRYAIIEETRAGGSGRFVVAYRNEYLLRDLIAPSCIAAFGFSSREEAVTRTNANALTNGNNEEREHGARREQQPTEWRASSQTIRRFLSALYDDAVATAIVAFSSRNVISVTVRRLLTV
jgi:hypothetical protein